MKKFYFKIVAFLFMNGFILFVLLAFSYVTDKNKKFENWETESSLFVIHEQQHYDMLILGNSHGRQFSRGSSHHYFENKTGKKMLNISRGLGGGGITNMLLNLEYFYEKKNTVDTILYFIDPYVFYYKEWNEESTFLNDEPLDPLYFKLCLKYGIGKNCLVNYARTKFSDEWWNKKETRYKFKSLTSVDSMAVAKRLKSMYLRTPQEADFQHYAEQMISLTELAKTKKAALVFIIPPTLLGKQPQTDRLLQFLEKIKRQYGITYLNHFDKVQNPRFYTDHDHLNEAGVRFYLDSLSL